MSTVSLRLPNYLHDKVRELAQQENVSINQFIVLAVAEKISALVTEDYLAERASRGSRDKFERAMAKVADTVTGVGWYRAEQWERLREISADGEKLEETYEDWVASAEESLREMRKVGLYAEKVEVDVEELLAWCRAQGRDVDGETRAQYAAVMLRQRYEGHSRESGG
jgi:hypothetical protein